MINVLRQSRTAVFLIDQHLHERKRMGAIKRAAGGIENTGTLPKKFLQRQRRDGVDECFDQWPQVPPRCKREYAVDQPIGWLNQYCPRGDVRLFSVDHFE